MSESRTESNDAIAVIGMACRLPGSEDPESFWRVLRDRQETVTEYPAGRTPELDRFFRRVGMPDGPASSRGGFLPDLDQFDATFFEVSPREAEWLDPQQRLLLEVGWEAIEDAGLDAARLRREKTGVFAGVWSAEYERHATAHSPTAEFFLVTGGPLYGISGRLAYEFDLCGPEISVNAACASSLVAVHLAVRSLRSGECSLALVGGTNAMVTLEFTQALSRSNMLSPDGRCKFGDASADGFVRSEGAGMLVLRRLSDAVADGDPILALIRGTAVVNDGRGDRLLATPSESGQRLAMLEALADAHVEPATVDFVQAHGTGTSAGDPIELSAIASVFGAREGRLPCRTSSVKSNIGHTESTAGVAGILAAIQALRHRWIPGSLHVKQLNPAIDWTAGVVLEREGSAWDATDGRPRRASVNGLGLTGTNAHVVLEEAPAAEPRRSEPKRAYLLPLSAVSEAALRERAREVAGCLREISPEAEAAGAVTDLCYTAAVRRTHLSHRFAAGGSSASDLKETLQSFVQQGQDVPWLATYSSGADRKPKIAFVFPGQGSQWIGMGRELLTTSAIFRQSLERISAAIEAEAGWSVLAQLEDPALEAELSRIDVVQPTLFAVEVALSELWQAWGIVPEAVVGHSMGEVAAAAVAGVLSLEDAARVICRRSRLLTRVAGKGAMLVVELSQAEAEDLIANRQDKVAVAVCNSARSTVLAGDAAVLDEFARALEEQGTFSRWVRVDVASHSPQMDELREDLFAALEGVAPRPNRIPLCSTVQVGMMEGARMDRAYWVGNLRRPVLFAAAVGELLAQGFDTFLEMSPHPILLPFVEQSADDHGRRALALGSLRRGEPETLTLLSGLAQMYAAGAAIDWKALYPSGNLVKLPAYPWQRERFWMHGEGRRRNGVASAEAHPLLGDPVRAATGEWLWNARLTLTEHAWLKDHAVGGTVLVPASAFAEMAAAVATAIYGNASAGAGVTIEKLRLLEAASLSEDGSLELQAVAAPKWENRFLLRFFTRSSDADEWTLCAEGTLRANLETSPEPAAVDVWTDAEFTSATETGAQHVARMKSLGYDFGPRFQRIEWMNREGNDALASIGPGTELGREKFLLHPAVLDAALQVLGRVLVETAAEPKLLLPVSVGSITWHGKNATGGLLVRATAAPDASQGDVEVCDAKGERLVSVRGLAFQPLEQANGEDTLAQALFGLEWQSFEPGAPEREGTDRHLLLIGEPGAERELLLDALAALGVEPSLMDPAEVTLDRLAAYPRLEGVVLLSMLQVRANSSLAYAQERLAECARLVAALGEATDGLEKSPRFWGVTLGTQSCGGETVSNVLGAGAWGLFAALCNEYPQLMATTVDLPEGAGLPEMERLARVLLASGHEDRVAVRQDGVFAQRLTALPRETDGRPLLAQSALREVGAGQKESLELAQRVRGSLESFELVAYVNQPPQPGEVEIAIEAAGMNFRDVLRATDALEALASSQIGGECAGTVVRVGEGVTGFRRGDAVLAMSPSFATTGMFSTRVNVPEALVAKKPDSLSFAQAAGIPCVFLTAWYALVRLARLEKGERVLIHAAAGGVGLAAVQIARWIGAEIFATVGSATKREYLRALGVQRIMHSRNLDFVTEIQAATEGRGVDVVLNSLAGAAIPAGLQCLGPYGRFVEIGKRDLWEDRQIGLRPFLNNLSMFAVDLSKAVEERRTMVAEMFAEVMDLFRRGVLEPDPTTVFPVSEAGEAFRLMASGGHIGKIVLAMQDSSARFRRDAAHPVAEATYLITGGVGGLGLVAAQGLVARGARHLVLTSRRAPSAAAEAMLEDLRTSGAEVHIRQCDVSRADELEAVLGEVEQRLPALRGIVHAAGVLDDATAPNLSREKIERVMAGKVGGALALDRHLARFDLDFLVYYSSAAGVLGNPGQGNYAAANTTLDALAQAQRARGIPATSIAWGSWAEVGLAAAEENRGSRLASQGLTPLTPPEGTALLWRVLEMQPVFAAAMHLDATLWCEHYPGAAESGLLENLRRHPTGSSLAENEFLGRLADAGSRGEREALLIRMVREQVAAVLRLDLDRVVTERPVRSLGLDSLMAIELRKRLERQTGLRLSATMVWNYPTVAAIATHLEGKLGASAEPEKPGRSTTPVPAQAVPTRIAADAGPELCLPEDAGRTAAELLAAELEELEELQEPVRS